MTAVDRRRFLQTLGAASAGLYAGCASAPTSSGPEKLRVALAGVRVQGRRHLDLFLRHPDVEVVALSDPDSGMLVQGARVAARHGPPPTMFQDPREMLKVEGIDVLAIATPDHWHALLAVAACAAGVHSYVETPVSHSIAEGERMVAAAREHGCFVQSALPARLHPAIQDAVQFVQDGGLGRVRWIRGVCYRYRPSIGQFGRKLEIPPQIDFDLWTGPAPMRPLTRRRLHDDWRWDWNTGNGEMGEAGTELLDVARWMLSRPSREFGRWPERLLVFGGRLGFDDDGESPNTLLAVLEFEGLPVVIDQRNLPSRYGSRSRMDRFRGLDYGLVVQGAGRHMVLDPRRPAAVVFEDDGRFVRQFRGEGSAVLNLLDTVRGRSKLRADIAIGRSASDLAHAVNNAYRAGHPAKRLDVIDEVGDDPFVLDRFDELDTHVGRNGLDLNREDGILSGWHRLDVDTGEFLDCPDANLLRAVTYREPFVLTEPGATRRKSPRVG